MSYVYVDSIKDSKGISLAGTAIHDARTKAYKDALPYSEWMKKNRRVSFPFDGGFVTARITGLDWIDGSLFAMVSGKALPCFSCCLASDLVLV